MTLRIINCQLIGYRLPLRMTWASARGEWRQRRGWLLQLQIDNDVGIGDCAPLPVAGTESIEAAQLALLTIQARAVGHDAATLLDVLEPELTATPATRWALECALLDVLSRQRGLTLRHFLVPTAPDVVPVNAMLGALAAVTPLAIHSAVAAGFTVLKLKVGLNAPLTELAQLRALARLLPTGVSLRLDANGAWDIATAQRMLDGLADLPIEALEEPLRQPDVAQFAALQQRVHFPLARDESLHTDLKSPQPPFFKGGLFFLPPLEKGGRGGFEIGQLGGFNGRLGFEFPRRIVLKPAAIGGMRRTLALAQQAQAAGCEVVMTSVIDSAVGLWATAQLAAASASPIPHGLATAAWLATDVGIAPQPLRGQLQLPMTPGSGFSPTNA